MNEVHLVLTSPIVSSSTNDIRKGELSGRTVVLIGGATGIGLRVAQLATAAGASVVLGGRTVSSLVEAGAQLGAAARDGGYALR